MRRLNRNIILSIAVLISQVSTIESARTKEKWEIDNEQWIKTCLARLPEYNRLRAQRGFERWTRQDAEGKCGYAWAVAKPETNAARHAKMLQETKSECFITSVCCDALGLTDDCFELATLRRFRDEVMRFAPGGAAEVAIYYEVAPMIVEEMQRRNDVSELKKLYFRYILPSVLLAKAGLHHRARGLYREMVTAMMMKYVTGPLQPQRSQEF